MGPPPTLITMNPILSNLNPTQLQAVTWPAAPLLVLAGAGSGKTRILTRRIAHVISQGVPPFHILGVTFTNKAAQEMRSRVEKLVRQAVWVSTFHSTCLRMLRQDGSAIGIDRNFTIYDEHDQLILIRECIQELKMNEKQVHPKGVRERIQRAKDVLITPFQYAEKGMGLYEDQVAKVYLLYEERLVKLKALDFGDLIMKTVALFDRAPKALRSWQDRFHHILIDEYQDTNHAQYRFVKLLAQAHRKITVVGDPDQSIYAWRGADIRNILNFEKDYPEAGVIRMEQNYRSTPVILQAANELIQRNEQRKPKVLWTERKEGEKIALFQAQDEKEEAAYVVREIVNYCAQGKTLADQVVFYRMHAQSRVLEDHLRRAKIPYKIVGGIRFYDRKEIKDIVAYLRAAAYPHDDISLKRILNVPSRGIGKKTIETLEEIAQKNQWGFDETLKAVGALQNLKGPGTEVRCLAPSALGPKAQKSIADFYRMITAFRSAVGVAGAAPSVSDLVTFILEKTGYVAALEAEKSIEAQARLENIQEFFSVISDWEETVPVTDVGAPLVGAQIVGTSGTRTDESDTRAGARPAPTTGLRVFLESISLMTDLDTWDNGTNVLTLMTFHTAKGLEFPIVFMVGMEEGIFPHVNVLNGSRGDSASRPYNQIGTDDELEEERRLCYVGMTRAKDKLHLTYAQSRLLYGSYEQNLPSRFLSEISSSLLQEQSISIKSTDAQHDDDLIIDYDHDEVKRRILFD